MLSHIVRGFRLGSLLSLSLLAAGWAAPAMAQVKLEHKFADGVKTVTHTNMKIKQTLTLAGMGLDSEQDRFVISTSQNGKRDADGKIRIEQKTDKLTSTAKLPGGLNLTFDSDDPNKKAENPALEPFMQAMRAAVKSKPVFVRDQSGKVIAVEGLEKAAEELPEELRGDFNPENAKKTANQELENLPGKPVKAGDTWTRNVDLPLGSGQVMAMTVEYKYLGEVKEGGKTFDKIQAKTTTVSFSIAENSALPLKVTKSDLKPTESAETILFDRAAGQVHSTKGKLRVQGDLNFTINGQALPGKLDLTIESEAVRQP
ncbi:MAG: hypothetical protein FJ302_03970 [Planctomycetes bacterium]|nr:hypothetical protein [Planctomycetota bacterium]